MTRSPERLIPFLEDREGWCFGYGVESRTHDCVRFVAAGVEAVTGVNRLEAIAPRWSTRIGARRALTRMGGLAAAVDATGLPRVEPMLARRGDVALTDGEALVLVEGDLVVGLAERGLYRLPRSAMVTAWAAD